MNAGAVIARAGQRKTVVPAYNIPYLPMVEPVICGIADEDAAAMVQVARIEWEKFGAESLEAVAKQFYSHKRSSHILLHLDHIPVIDEDMRPVDYTDLLERAIAAGYQSVMVDGSRLPLEENIRKTEKAAQLARNAGIPCEAELGSVFGHESTEPVRYEEIFAKKLGFTKLDEAEQFVRRSGCDWLSVAVGSVHGAAAEHLRNLKKPEARLDVAHIGALSRATGLPLVLHGGSGVRPEDLKASVQAGIVKINVGAELRQPYEETLRNTGGSLASAAEAVYRAVRNHIRNIVEVSGSFGILADKL